MGLGSQAISVRAENTRPCISGETFDCQMAWLEPLINGLKREESAIAPIQTGSQTLKPISDEKKLAIIQPASTPWTRRLNPPHSDMPIPPTTPPIAPADWTRPRLTVLLSVLKRIMGTKTVKAIPIHKFPKKKTSCSPNRLGRAKIYLKPNAASLNIFPWATVPSAVRG